MLAIRLRRAGSKKRPFFRVVVMDSRAARDSSFIEILGHYNPRTTPETLKIARERMDFWLQKGAQPSDTVRTLVDRMPPAPPESEAPVTAAPTAGVARSAATETTPEPAPEANPS